MEVNEEGRLSPAQQRAAVLIAQGLPARAVARQVDVTEQTIGRWKEKDEFVQAVALEGHALDAKSREDAAAFTEALRQGKREALEVLKNQMRARDPMIALKAAELMLKY
jgi:hypothetical protein